MNCTFNCALNCPFPLQKIGSGKFGGVYEWYDHVIKIMSKKEDNDGLTQIAFQERAALIGLSIPVFETWNCSHGTRFSMPRLECTFHDDLLLVTSEQLDEAKSRLHSSLVKMIDPLSELELERLRPTLEKYNTTLRLDELVQHYQHIQHMYTEATQLLPPFVETYLLSDPPEQRTLKRTYLKKVLECMSKLHQSGIVHNDSHIENFMRKGERYYAIDFGKSIEIEDEEAFEDDCSQFRMSLFQTINNYSNPRKGLRLNYIGLDLSYLKKEYTLIKNGLNAL